MIISEILTPQGVSLDLKAAGKKQALQELAGLAAKHLHVEGRVILDALIEREHLGTTGFGSGVAIPHGKLAGIDRMFMMFARFAVPVPFDALDGRPVDLMFLLLAPENAGADHLTALAKASRILRDDALCAKIRGSATKEAIYSLILES